MDLKTIKSIKEVLLKAKGQMENFSIVRPSIKNSPKGFINTPRAKKTTKIDKIKGTTQTKKVDPVKQAQQIQNKDIKGAAVERAQNEKINQGLVLPKEATIKPINPGSDIKDIKLKEAEKEFKIMKGLNNAPQTEILKYNKGGQWELNDSQSIKKKKKVEKLKKDANKVLESLEKLEKALFPEPIQAQKKEEAKAEIPKEESKANKKKYISNDIKYLVNDLKQMKDLRWTVEDEWENKDKATFEKIKAALELKYNKIKSEIKELADKFGKIK